MIKVHPSISSYASILCILILIACQESEMGVSNSDKVESKEINEIRSTSVSGERKADKVEDSSYKYLLSYYSEAGYSVDIETRLLYDSAFLNNNYYKSGNKAVISQTLTFKKNGRQLRRFNYLQSYRINNVKSRLPSLMKFVATEISITGPKKNPIYVFYAWGLSNGSNEVTSYYSKEGNLLLEINCGRHDCDSIVNARKNDIEKWSNSKLKSHYIFPPKLSKIKLEAGKQTNN